MLIDFSPLDRNELKMVNFAKRFTIDDLRSATNASIDRMLEIISDLTDEQVAFIPDDPHANDPHAVPGEEHIGWSLAHLVVHVTASSEEGAAYSSILARGIPYPREPRLRYETHWHSVTTKAQTIQRLEESRRIRLSFLDTWPDQPHLETQRELTERGKEVFGALNAAGAFLNGLKHEMGHWEQFLEVRQQALKATAAATGD